MLKQEELSVNWAQIEVESCSGKPVIADNHNVAVFKARSEEFDLRRADALCQVGSTEFLQELRTLIARGNFKSAQVKMAEYANSPSQSANPEYQLEVARLMAFSGEWQLAARAFSELLQSDLSGPSRMTALQTRAMMYYELGQMEMAYKDSESVESLSRLYPQAQAAFYNLNLKVRLQIARGDLSQAKRMLHALWEHHLARGTLDCNRLLTLLRTESHLGFCQGLALREAILGSLALAEIIGDDQYAALARLELFCAGDRSASLVRQLSDDRMRHPRVDLLLREIELRRPRCTSALSLANVARSPSGSSGLGYDDYRSDYEAIMIPKRRLLVMMRPFGVQQVPRITTPFQALQLIASPFGLSKEQLFEGLYGPARYSPVLHDKTLHQTLGRIRRTFGVTINVEKSQVTAPGVLLIEELS